MKFLVVNRFFGGSQIPTGRMAEDVARLLVQSGHEVAVLASTGTYAGAEKQAQHRAWSMEHGAGGKRQTADGVKCEEVHVPTWMPRALAWLWFTWQARKRIPRMDWDVCVLMTDPPLLPLLARRAAGSGRLKDQKTKRPKDDEPKNRTTEATPHRATRRVAVWLMDLYPEALAASGRMSAQNPIYLWYLEKRQRALAAADLLICLGEAQEKRLRVDNGTTGPQDHGTWTEGTELQNCRMTEPPRPPRGLGPRTAVVPPWDDRGNIALATGDSLRNLALYAGNLGEAHCFEEILAAAPFLPADWRIRFAARGAKLAALAAAASELKRPKDEETKRRGATLEVTGYASEEETPQLLASARVHLIAMSPGWEGIVVPSKLYGCIRTGRPVLFIGPENADTAREIRRNDWGAVLPTGTSGEKVAAAILELAARPTKLPQKQLGAKEVAELLQSLATD